MEHPVPQNVTTFEFHLVGDMTLKQFAYLGSGLVIAYLVFVFLYPVSPLIFLPITVVSALIGAAFAFLPIADRPLDHWFRAFLKAAYSPTQGTWLAPLEIKNNQNLVDPLLNHRLQMYLQAVGLSTPTPTPVPTLAPTLTSSSPDLTSFRQIKKSLTPQSTPSKIIPPTPVVVLPETVNQQLPSSSELTEVVEIAKQAQDLQNKLTSLQTRMATVQDAPVDLKRVYDNLQDLVKQTQNARIPAAKKTVVRVVEASPSQPTQPALTSFPNIISGMVTDSENNYLEGVIAIIHNQDGLPVRALKTNKLGQFTGATPLPSGTYNISLEKDGYLFDTLQTTLSGELLTPIKITAKKEDG